MNSNNNDENFYFIRLSEVILLTSIPKSSIHVEIAEGNFPKPVELSARSRAWVKSEVLDWMQEKIEDRDK